MGLTRTFQLREKQTFEFRAEAFNVPNHVNLNNPASTVLSNPQIGVITTVLDPRILQCFEIRVLTRGRTTKSTEANTKSTIGFS